MHGIIKRNGMDGTKRKIKIGRDEESYGRKREVTPLGEGCTPR